MNVGIYAPNWIGDAVLSLPFLNPGRRTFPEARITIVAKVWAVAVFEHHPSVDNIITFDGAQLKGLLPTIRSGRSLRAAGFDCFYLLSDSLRSACLARRCPNVTVLPLEAYNILPAFQWADVLVSESSSTIIEFTALDRPIVVCDQLHLRLHHKRRRKKFFQRRMDTELLSLLDFAHHTPAADQVANRVSYALEHPDELSDQRRAGRDLLVGPCDGQASQRIVDFPEKAVA